MEQKNSRTPNVFSPTALSGQIALVTGSSRGIGADIARAMCACQAYTYINYSHSESAACKLKEELDSQGFQSEILKFDVADSQEVDAAIKSIVEKHGKLDILVNNAGIAIDSLLVRSKDIDWQKTLDVNLSGSFYCARAAAKVMMRRRFGRIINISSVIGQTGNAGQVAYSASKGGLIALTKSMALELGSRGVTVNAVAPGYVVTDMTAGLNEQQVEDTLSRIPLGRLGSVSDISGVVVFLASDASSYITGQVFGVNGGMYV